MSQVEVRPLLDQVIGRLEANDASGAATLVLDLHPSDLADLVEALPGPAERAILLRALPADAASEALAEMEEGESRGELLGALAPSLGAELIHELADDDAADLMAELEPEERAAILAQLSAEEAGELEGLLRYDEETAGGLMTTQLVSIGDQLTAEEAIEEVRRQGKEVEDFYTVFVVDERGRLLGSVGLGDLILADPGKLVSHLVEPVVASVSPSVDQEEVGRLMSRYNLVSVAVVDDAGRMLGRITFDDVIDVIEQEQTEDILRLAGVGDEEEVKGRWSDAVRTRLPWLLLNLLTATGAASMVLIFADAIERVVVLAFLMPIIAGLGGNAGTQALAVTLRRLTLSDGPQAGSWSVVGKEALIGVINGAVLGCLLGLLAYWKAGLPMLGVVVTMAMWGNLVVAGLAGAFIPTVLNRLGIDPAVASSVFIVTLTDLFGFLFLLGLASAFLL